MRDVTMGLVLISTTVALMVTPAIIHPQPISTMALALTLDALILMHRITIAMRDVTMVRALISTMVVQIVTHATIHPPLISTMVHAHTQVALIR